MSLGNYTANITIESPDANNSPHIVPVNLHISLTGTLRGQVNFMGRGTPGTDRWVETFVVRFFDNATKVEKSWSPINATTNNTGVFTITGVVAGKYDIAIKNWTCLSEVVTNVTLSAGALTVVDFGTTREGDANGNDAVTGMDFSLVSGVFNTAPPGNPNCDFDRNGAVSGMDFSLLNGNFNKVGSLVGYLGY